SRDWSSDVCSSDLRVFEGQNMSSLIRVDVVDHRGHGGGFSRTRGSGHQNQTVWIIRGGFKNFRKIEFFKGGGFFGEDAADDGKSVSLIKYVYSKNSDSFGRERKINGSAFFQFLVLMRGHNLTDEILNIVGTERSDFRRNEFSSD